MVLKRVKGQGVHSVVHKVQGGCLVILPDCTNTLQEEADVIVDRRCKPDPEQEAEGAPG